MNFEVKIPVKINIVEQDWEILSQYIDKESLSIFLTKLFTYWDEGRNSFETEQIISACKGLFEQSIIQCIESKLVKIYGQNVMVPTSDNTSINKVCLETDAVLKKLSRYLVYCHPSESSNVEVKNLPE